MTRAIVLLAHGSRDPGWSRPLEALAGALAARSPGRAVRCAYLEHTPPTLAQAVAELVRSGARSVDVVPALLGQGSHLKQDLPKLVAAARSAHPQAVVELQPSLGEAPEVLEAIAAALARRLA